MKDTVVWNIEQGLKLTGPDLAHAEAKRTAQPYVTEINGESLPTYIDWIRACSDITVTGLPAISVPCGFTDSGLPVGIQIVGRHRDEWGVLQLAYAFEQATGFGKRRPAIAQP